VSVLADDDVYGIIYTYPVGCIVFLADTDAVTIARQWNFADVFTDAEAKPWTRTKNVGYIQE